MIGHRFEMVTMIVDPTMVECSYRKNHSHQQRACCCHTSCDFAEVPVIIADIKLAELVERHIFHGLFELTQGARWEIKCWNNLLSRTLCKGYPGSGAGNTFPK